MTQRNGFRVYRAGAVLLAALAAAVPSHAESVLKSLPVVRSIYEQKVERLNSGQPSRTFLGSASVAPRYGFPWMTSIQVRGAPPTAGHFCGGVAITESWISTAAHCVATATRIGEEVSITPLEPGQLQVLVGSNVLFGAGEPRPISRVVVHPRYRIVHGRVPESDIALLQVGGEPNLIPLRMPTASQADEILRDGEKIRILGWGTAYFSADAPVSYNLLYTFVDVIERSRCNAPAMYDGAVSETMFCAGLGFADACQGDSGGPAIGYVNGEKFLVGITSWGVGCSNKSYPGVYVNVARFAQWMREAAGAR